MPADTVSPTPSAEPNVEEIRARAEAATPGPWSADGTCEPNEYALRRFPPEDERNTDPELPQLLGVMFDEVAPGETVDGEANAEFIAHARTDIPAVLSSLAEARRERDALDIELAMRNSDFYDAQAELRALRETLARQNRDTSRIIVAADAELRELRETALTREEAAEVLILIGPYSEDWATAQVLPKNSPHVNATITAYAKLSRISAGTPTEDRENG